MTFFNPDITPAHKLDRAHRGRAEVPRPSALVIALHLGLLGLAAGGSLSLPGTVLAQPNALPPGHAVKSFDVPAGPLDTALSRFARIAGVNLSYDAALLRERTTRGLVGAHSVEAGLAALLTGSGIEAVAQSGGGYLLQPINRAPVPATSVPSSVQTGALPTVRVKAATDVERASGPTYGHIATRSATATKTDAPLNETARSISVITREQVEAQAPVSMQDTLGYTPGIFAPPLAAASTDSTSGMAIRGMKTQDGDAYYQDGMRGKFSGWWGFSGYEPFAFERIEVLRGPASILYGQGQPNGTINLVSKRPLPEPVREVSIEYGSFRHQQITADLSGLLDASGEWSYRLTALGRDSGTQIDFSENKRWFAALALAWRPSGRTELVLRAGYQRNEGESNNNLPMAGTLRPNPNGPISRHRAIADDNRAHYDNRNIGWLLEHRADEVWTFRSNMRLNQQSGARRSARSDGFQSGQARIIDRSVNNYWSMDGNYNLALDNQAQARIRVGEMEHIVLAGIDFARQKDGWQVGGGSAAPVDLFSPVYVPVVYSRTANYERTAHDRQVGMYLQDQLKLGKQWVLSLGGRKDWARSWEHSGTPGANEASSSQKDSAFTWQAGAAHLSGRGLTSYLSYAESFLPTLGQNMHGVALKPETGRQYEAGLKYQPAGGRLLLTGAIFDIRRQNVTTSDPVEPMNRIQTGEVSSRGLELEARAEPLPGLNLIGSYSYIRAKVSKSHDGDQGKTLVQSPRQTASLWLDYAFRDSALAGLTVGTGLRYLGATWADPKNTERVSGYAIFDLTLKYDLVHLSPGLAGAKAYLNIKNLADKSYMTCFYADCLYGLERSATAGIRYSW